MPSTDGLFMCCLCPSLSPVPPPLCPSGHHICPTCHLLTNEEQEEWLDDYLQASLVEPCLLGGLWVCERCELLSMMALRVCSRCGTERGETYRLVAEGEAMRWAVRAVLFCLEDMVRSGKWRRGEGEGGGGEENDREEEEEEEEETKYGDDKDEEDEDLYCHDDDEEE